MKRPLQLVIVSVLMDVTIYDDAEASYTRNFTDKFLFAPNYSPTDIYRALDRRYEEEIEPTGITTYTFKLRKMGPLKGKVQDSTFQFVKRFGNKLVWDSEINGEI